MRLSSLCLSKDLTSDPEITHIAEDSRDVVPGTLFFAQNGSRQSGVAFVSDALMRGAVAIIVPNDAELPNDLPALLPVIRAQDGRALISEVSNRFYPRQPDTIVAVTGTSGKTSTTYFVQQILNHLHHPSVSVGTIGVAGAMTEKGSLTTPEAPRLHGLLQRLSDKHITHVAMEASSQALVQHRMDHVRLRAAAFTNLSRDHLDYHGTMEDYFAAKKILFETILPQDGVAVLNADDDCFPTLSKLCEDRGLHVLSFGFAGKDIRLIAQDLHHNGQTITVEMGGEKADITLTIGGAFQASNVVCALGLVRALGVPAVDLFKAAQTLQAPPGRLQPVPGHPRGAAIYVDYAHKPDALQSVLEGLRAHNPRRLVCVFGCGGDRDPGKRRVMGEIAARLADDVIITDDNPRSEDPADIRAAIRTGAPTARDIGNRREAIRTALSDLQAGDILLIAGKGHETGQIFADHTEPFNDLAETISLLSHLSSV